MGANETSAPPSSGAGSSGMGLARLTGVFFSPVKRGGAAGIIVTPWLVVVGLGVAWNAIF